MLDGHSNCRRAIRTHEVYDPITASLREATATVLRSAYLLVSEIRLAAVFNTFGVATMNRVAVVDARRDKDMNQCIDYITATSVQCPCKPCRQRFSVTASLQSVDSNNYRRAFSRSHNISAKARQSSLLTIRQWPGITYPVLRGMIQLSPNCDVVFPSVVWDVVNCN